MPRPPFLRSLPDAPTLLDRLRVMSMLDAVMTEERMFEYHPRWSRGVKVGAFKDGSGNFFFLWVSAKGAVIRGFDHESPMSPFRSDPPAPWPGLWDGLPKALAPARDEPAFVAEEITFAMWRMPADDAWRTGPITYPKREGTRRGDPDGAKDTLAPVLGSIAKFARDLYEVRVDEKVQAALASGRLDRATLEALNPEFDEDAVKEEAKLCGFTLRL